MTDPGFDWRKLNAYVDGELPAQEAASVARAAEADPEIADQIELLYRLKGAVRGAMPSAPEGLAETVAERPAARSRWRPVLAVAAVLAAAGLVAPMLLRGEAPTAPAPAAQPAAASTFLATARKLHADWLAHDTGAKLVPMPVVIDTLTRFGRLPLVPDLQSTGLEIGMINLVDGHDGRLLEIGYRGHHGCHLSLFIASGTGVPDTSAGRTPQERSKAWGVEDLAYLMIADGMDPSRFDLIAAKVEGASRRFAPLDHSDRQLLAANHAQAKTCQV